MHSPHPVSKRQLANIVSHVLRTAAAVVRRESGSECAADVLIDLARDLEMLECGAEDVLDDAVAVAVASTQARETVRGNVSA